MFFGYINILYFNIENNNTEKIIIKKKKKTTQQHTQLHRKSRGRFINLQWFSGTMPTIIRYAEIGTKGKNRSQFENRLIFNLRDCLKKNHTIPSKIVRERGRILVYSDSFLRVLKDVFGVASLSGGVECPLDLESIQQTALSLATASSFQTFKVDAQRMNKSFPLTSLELNQQIGKHIQEKTGATVLLSNPDLTIGIEILGNAAFLFTNRVEGRGGLPIGTQGKVLSSIDSKASLLAAYLLMRRGSEVVFWADDAKAIAPLEKYSYGQRNLVFLKKEKKSLDELLRKEKIKAVSLPGNHYPKKTLPGILCLDPLIGFSEEEIHERCEALF